MHQNFELAHSYFPLFAILSENEELKEQLAQLAKTKVRIHYIILIIIITVRSGQTMTLIIV